MSVPASVLHADLFLSPMYDNVITYSDSPEPVNNDPFPLTPNLIMIYNVGWTDDRGVSQGEDMWDLASVMSTVFSTFCLRLEKTKNNTDIYFTLDH